MTSFVAKGFMAEKLPSFAAANTSAPVDVLKEVTHASELYTSQVLVLSLKNSRPYTRGHAA